MRKKIVWIVLAAVLVIVLAAAAVLYPRLSAKVAPSSPTVPAQTQEEGAQEEESLSVQAEPEQAADFIVTDDNGDVDMLSAHLGKPVVVNFWATWCSYCVEELPYFNAASKKYGDSVDFMMVDLTDGYRETVESARAFASQRGFTFPVYYDTTASASDAYSIYSIPMTLFITPDGKIWHSCVGAITEDVLEQSIEALLEQ